MMEAIKVNARIGPDHQLIWVEPLPPLAEGNVEVILLYTETAPLLPPAPIKWPVLNGGRYLGGTLRREEIYDDAR